VYFQNIVYDFGDTSLHSCIDRRMMTGCILPDLILLKKWKKMYFFSLSESFIRLREFL